MASHSSTRQQSLSRFTGWMLVLICFSRQTTIASVNANQIEDVSASDNATSKDKREGPIHPLSIQIQMKQPFLLFNLMDNTLVTMNYTLRCEDTSSVYSVLAISTNKDVTTIAHGNPVLISCKPEHTPNSDRDDPSSVGNMASNVVEVKPMAPGSVAFGNGSKEDSTAHTYSSIVTGEFVMKFKSKIIGRSFLLMVASQVAGPGTPKSKVGNVSSSDMTLGQGSHKTADPGSGSSVAHPSSPKGGPPPNTVLKSMIIVMQLPQLIHTVFRVVLYITVITATMGMGFKVEFDVIKKVLKKPMGPAIGLFCQYVCMPLIAYGVAKLVPQPTASISLGIFTCGIVPGGGQSNFFCFLLGGDVSLSVTMTTISCVMALGMVPLWMYTLGNTFKDETTDLFMPYAKILEVVAIITLPIFVGMLIKYKFPRAAKLITKIMKPFLVVVVLLLLGLGLYSNFHIFSMIQPMQILAGCLLPYIGYVVGGSIALITRQPWAHVKTIAIETGIQNVSVALIMVMFSLPPPDNQLAMVAPAASAIMTPLPLIVAVFVYTIYQRRKKKKKEESYDAEELADGEDREKLEPAVEKISEQKKPLSLFQRLTTTGHRRSTSENNTRTNGDDEKLFKSEKTGTGQMTEVSGNGNTDPTNDPGYPYLRETNIL